MIGQELSVGAGYQYMYSAAWDKAIQTYNFSRPFLEEKQPLLTHGSYLESSYFFKSEKSLRSGIKLNYSFTRSRADNSNFDVRLNLNQLQLGYSLRYIVESRWQAYIIEGDVFIHSTLLSRRTNGELDVRDGNEKNRAHGIGGGLALTAFSTLAIKESKLLFPFFGISYSPYLRTEKSEIVLNQTDGLVKKQNRILTFKIGIRVNIKG